MLANSPALSLPTHELSSRRVWTVLFPCGRIHQPAKQSIYNRQDRYLAIAVRSQSSQCLGHSAPSSRHLVMVKSCFGISIDSALFGKFQQVGL